MRINRLIPAIVALTLSGSVANAQYPNVDKSLIISDGDTVHLLNRIVIDRAPAMIPPGGRLEFVYRTTIPASDVPARAAQADRAAQLLGPQAVELGVRRLAIGICDTQQCAERKHPPSIWYLYERSANGWRRAR